MVATTMPAAEVKEAVSLDDERSSYEFAFHILPTVAEGEVPGVFEDLKALITKEGGELMSEEAPERIDLVYEITRQIDGKNKKFGSAYFGWVRFRLDGEKITHLTSEIETHDSILRYLLIKLTKLEEANPFRFHESRKSVKMVEVVDEGEVLKETQTETEEKAEVSDVELDKSLDKLTSDEEEGEEDKS